MQNKLQLGDSYTGWRLSYFGNWLDVANLSTIRKNEQASLIRTSAGIPSELVDLFILISYQTLLTAIAIMKIRILWKIFRRKLWFLHSISYILNCLLNHLTTFLLGPMWEYIEYFVSKIKIYIYSCPIVVTIFRIQNILIKDSNKNIL